MLSILKAVNKLGDELMVHLLKLLEALIFLTRDSNCFCHEFKGDTLIFNTCEKKVGMQGFEP